MLNDAPTAIDVNMLRMYGALKSMRGEADASLGLLSMLLENEKSDNKTRFERERKWTADDALI